MWKKLSDLFCSVCFPWASGPKCEECDEWAQRNAVKTNPDEILKAVFIESITKNFEDWLLFDIKLQSPHITDPKLYNQKWKEAQQLFKKQLEDVGLLDYADHYRMKGLVNKKRKLLLLLQPYIQINKVAFNSKYANEIETAWFSIRDKRAELKRIADKAKKDMEDNEAKWNLVENLLGMKRDKNGALRALSQVIRDDEEGDMKYA